MEQETRSTGGRLARRYGRLAIACCVAGAGSALVAAPAAFAVGTHVKKITFAGSYRGSTALVIDNGSVTISSVTGRGTGTQLGPSTVSGSGSAAASAQCDPFSGSGSLAGKTGKILFKVASSSSQGCSSGESGPVSVSFHGTARAVGGTGKFKGASGSLKFSGTLHLPGTSGSQSGTYTVKLNGTLAVK